MESFVVMEVGVVLAFFESMKWTMGKLVSTQEKKTTESIRKEFWIMRDMIRDIHEEYKTRKIAKAVKNNQEIIR